MSVEHDIHVGIGEVKTGKSGDILKANLGSCVGIAFIWKERGRFGLAHCLLPEMNAETSVIGAKFVSQAVPSLIALLRIKPEDIKDIIVYIAGGGNMMAQLSLKNSDHIGLQNLASAKRHLKKYGFKYHELDVGGNDGRQIILDCTSGAVSVINFQKQA